MYLLLRRGVGSNRNGSWRDRSSIGGAHPSSLRHRRWTRSPLAKERLGCTVQFSDTGISPGSGVQNRRRELSKATLSVPVIAVGVPTVVDASGLLQKESRTEPMMVTPRNIDQLIRHAARLLSLSINRALQPTLSVEEIEMLVN